MIVENASLYTDKHIFNLSYLLPKAAIPVSKNDSGKCIPSLYTYN
jgi:hypothetical protein